MLTLPALKHPAAASKHLSTLSFFWNLTKAVPIRQYKQIKHNTISLTLQHIKLEDRNVPQIDGTVIPLRDTSLIHRSGCLSPTQIREYVNIRRTIHPSIHSRRSSAPCGCCTCLEFIATQCSVYVVAGILLSTSKDLPVRCIISSLTLNAILELNFVQCPCNSSCDSVT